MSEYIPSPSGWVAEQVELYEGSGGTEGLTLRDTGLPVIIVTNRGWKTGAIRKTPLMRAVDGNSYILVASQGGAPKHPLWYHNLKADPNVEIRDKTEVYAMRVREVVDSVERQRLWDIAVEAYPPYQEYQKKTDRLIPLFVAEPIEANKKNAISFYQTAYLGNPKEAVEKYVGDEYIQHNPLVGNGKEAFIEYFERMTNEYPEKSIKFVRSVAEGDLVALHTHQIWPGGEEYVTMDFFRFDDNGKIVEHWDSVQEIPETTKNGNTMY